MYIVWESGMPTIWYAKVGQHVGEDIETLGPTGSGRSEDRMTAIADAIQNCDDLWELVTDSALAAERRRDIDRDRRP